MGNNSVFGTYPHNGGELVDHYRRTLTSRPCMHGLSTDKRRDCCFFSGLRMKYDGEPHLMRHLQKHASALPVRNVIDTYACHSAV